MRQGLVLLSVPAILMVTIWKAEYIISLLNNLPKCYFHKVTGGYCPACGNTRSVIALLHGNVLSAVKYNALIPYLSLLILLLYIELFFRFIGREVKIIPRSNAFLAASVLAFLCYFFLRNVFPVLAPA